jgi:5-methylcytosine-specific restriction endonuclease McrA
MQQWVMRHKGKAFGCEVCATTEQRLYNWTSRSGQRLRDLDDWMSICIPCRRKQSKLVPWNKGKRGIPLLKARGPRPHVQGNATSFKKGQPTHNKGKKMPSYSGENHPAWKGGVTKLSHKIRTSVEYKNWRLAVLERDNFTCVLCGYVSSKPRDMRADHIKPFHLYPELRFDVANGRALCVPCDHAHGWQVWHKTTMHADGNGQLMVG